MSQLYYSTWSRQTDSNVLPVSSAEHDEFILSDGSRVYDFLSTSFQANFGHSQPSIIDNIKQQLDQMSIASPKAEFELKDSATQKLQLLLGLNDGKIFYSVSGAEAVENALKIARQIKKTKKVIARQRSYHGATLGALSVTGDWRNAPHYTCDQGTIRIPEPSEDPDLKKTRRVIESAGPQGIAAMILETITGANGVIIPSPKWYWGIQDLCREFDILLILDEVLCGFGRTGKPFGFQHYDGLQPDMICMSKGITGGYIPFGALWTSQKIADYYDQKVFACGLTNYGHPLGLAAMEASIDLMNDDEFQANASNLESSFQDRLIKFNQKEVVKEIRVRGLLAAIEFQIEAPTWAQGIENGIHFFSKGNMTVLAPPLISTGERLNQAFNAFERLVDSIAKM